MKKHKTVKTKKPARQFQIAVSGAAAGESVDDEWNLATAARIGEEIAAAGHVLITGATTGLPYAAAIGAKRRGGLSVGISPATGYKEHVTKYKLPTDVFDTIMYTGFGYTGRNIFIIRSADAIISIGGRIGTLNEFTIAFEEKIPIGVLVGSGGVADDIKHLLRVAEKGNGKVIFSSEPKELVSKIIRMVSGHSVVTGITPAKVTTEVLRKVRRLKTKPEIG